MASQRLVFQGASVAFRDLFVESSICKDRQPPPDNRNKTNNEETPFLSIRFTLDVIVGCLSDDEKILLRYNSRLILCYRLFGFRSTVRKTLPPKFQRQTTIYSTRELPIDFDTLIIEFNYRYYFIYVTCTEDNLKHLRAFSLPQT